MGDGEIKSIWTMKLLVATMGWTVAIGAAIGRTWSGEAELAVWAVLAAAVGLLASIAVVCDFVAERATKHVLREIAKERAATVKMAVKAMREHNQTIADRLVERLSSKQDRTLERVGAEIAAAMREDSDGPTRIR